MSTHAENRSGSNSRYLNAVLTAIACLLLLNLLAGGGVLPRSASAVAQEAKPSDLPFNSGDQRNRMTAALESMDARLAKIELKMDKGFNVKVTEMPPVKLIEDKKDDRARKDAKPAEPAGDAGKK